jgi:hypothetical protein
VTTEGRRGDDVVTRAGDGEHMTDQGDPTGALVIRVWRAPGRPDAPLIARFLGRLDVETDETEPPDYAAGIDEILARTREWLERYDRATSGE